MTFDFIKDMYSSTKRQPYRFSLYSCLLFCLIFILTVSLVFVSDYRRFEKNFNVDVDKLQAQFDFFIKQNEAVSESFSAFIAGLGKVDETLLNSYAEKIMARFPNVYMLEVAEEVKKENLKAFEKRQRKKGYAGFEVKYFDYSVKRKWEQLHDAERYFPLSYLYPLTEETKPILGLELGTNKIQGPFLYKSIYEGGYQTTLPFNIIEGDRAFVIYKAVDAINPQLKKIFVTLVVVTVKNFIFDIDKNDDSLGLLIYHNSLSPSDTKGHFISRGFNGNIFLPHIVTDIAPKSQNISFTLRVTKQFQLKDINWLFLLGLLSAVMFVFFYMGFLVTKNKIQSDKAQKTLQQKNKMLAISTLTGGVAHEFNNKLSVVRGFLSLLSDKNRSDKESLSWIKHTEEAAEKCINLTHKLLVYSRYQGASERLSKINITNVIHKFSDKIYVKNKVILKYYLTNNLPLVLLNENDLIEILSNLVLNANESIEDEGYISISTSTVELTGKEDIEAGVATIAGKYVKVSVSDSGKGVAEDIKLYIFDPFFTTKKFGDGSGMGLAIVYGLVKLNKGYVDFHSTANKETVFNVYFPLIN